MFGRSCLVGRGIVEEQNPLCPPYHSQWAFATSPPHTTTTKPFVPSIWGRLHEPKENYAGLGTWINFLHSFLSSNMPSLRPLAYISCRITSIHVFFSLLCALLTCPNLIRSTRRTGLSVGLRRTWSNHHRRFSLFFSSIWAMPILV